MGTYQKTKGIQSYLRMWGSYDPIESDPLEPKNWVLYGHSEKKCKFLAKNYSKSALVENYENMILSKTQRLL